MGARHACPKCLRRGLGPTCTCGADALDLETREGAAFAERAQGEGRIEPGRASIERWWGRQTKSSRVEWIFAAIAAFGIVLTILAESQPDDGWSKLLVFPFYFFFLVIVRLITFLAVLLLRLMGVLALLVASLVTAIVEHFALRRRGEGHAGKLLGMMGPLLEVGSRRRWTSEPARLRPPTPELEGTLERVGSSGGDSLESDVLSIERFEGRKGDMVFADARVPPFHLRVADDELVRIDLAVGALVLPPSPAPKAAHEDAKARIDLDSPSWLPAEVARGPREVELGSRLGLFGGEWSEEASSSGGGDDFRHAPRIRVLRGTAETPLWVEILQEGNRR